MQKHLNFEEVKAIIIANLTEECQGIIVDNIFNEEPYLDETDKHIDILTSHMGHKFRLTPENIVSAYILPPSPTGMYVTVRANESHFPFDWNGDPEVEFCISFLVCAVINDPTAKPVPKEIKITGREWFSKSAGVSYFAVRVYVEYENNELDVEFRLPYTGGYGDAYVRVALKECKRRGIIDCEPNTQSVRDGAGIRIYSTIKDTGYREMVAWGKED